MQMTKAEGRVFLDAGADLLHHLDVDADEVIAAHAGLARHARRHDAHVRALDVGVGVRALEVAVEALDRTRLRDIERLALGQALRDVEEDDVAQFLEADEVRERASDHPSADQGDLRARHRPSLPLLTI